MKEEILAAIGDAGVKGAFVLRDLESGSVIQHNEDTVVPSASLIKLPVMAEAFRQAKCGRLNLQQRVRVKPADRVPFSVISLLDAENTYTVLDLITLMIIQSDNTAANVLMDMIGMENVNRFIRDETLEGTRLQRKMMDADARREGRENLTTAGDMTALLLRVYEEKLVDAESSRMMLGIMKNQLNDSMLRLHLPDGLIIAHKTGDLEGINHDVGIVYGNGFSYLTASFGFQP